MDVPESEHTEDILKDVSMVDMSGQSMSMQSRELSPTDVQSTGLSPTSGSAMALDRNLSQQTGGSDTPTSSSFGEAIAPMRRKSTLILTDEADFDRLKLLLNKLKDEDERMTESDDTPDKPPQQETPELIPIELQWRQGGERVFITGSFTAWRKMIAMNGPYEDGSFNLKLSLPLGTHRFRFIVDNELRFSDFLPTATDQMGNFVNYIEIEPQSAEINELNESLNDHLLEEKSKFSKSSKSVATIDRLTNDDDDMGGGYSRYHGSEDGLTSQPKLYIQTIPPIFTDPKVMEQYYQTLDNNQQNNNNQQWLIPPQLPPHLENVILNNFNTDKDNNSGSLPIPNHVVLNHLATTSIKHNTLAVASVVRYQRKYLTQILYAPLQ